MELGLSWIFFCALAMCGGSSVCSTRRGAATAWYANNKFYVTVHVVQAFEHHS